MTRRWEEGCSRGNWSNSVFIWVLGKWMQPLCEISLNCVQFPLWVLARGKESACNAGDADLIPGSGRSPGRGNGNPLQYSCLENPIDKGAWQATVHGVTNCWTRLKQLSIHTVSNIISCFQFFKGYISNLNLLEKWRFFFNVPVCTSLISSPIMSSNPIQNKSIRLKQYFCSSAERKVFLEL